MRIRHPISFFLLIGAVTITATIAVTWNIIHIVGLAADIGLIAAIRFAAHHEGRKD